MGLGEMNCGCESLRLSMERSRMRKLAKRAALLDGCNYVLYEYKGVYGFVRQGEEHKGRQVEIVRC